jgi:predicted transcriptional regulator
MRRPSRLEIYLDLLQAVSKHRDPISVGRTLNLSQSDTENHLSFLAQQGLVKTKKQGNNIAKHELTLRGLEALTRFENYLKMNDFFLSLRSALQLAPEELEKKMA